MGSGKTKRGRKIAAKIGFRFYDLDELIEKKYNKSIFEIFQNSGEKSFREYEQMTLMEILNSDNFVLSTGGGTPCYFNNMELMNSHGITIYLKVEVKVLTSRLINKKINRPLIKDKNEEELELFIAETLRHREEFYCQSKLIFDALKTKNGEIINQLEI
jgi:shikimate kinase